MAQARKEKKLWRRESRALDVRERCIKGVGESLQGLHLENCMFHFVTSVFGGLFRGWALSLQEIDHLPKLDRSKEMEGGGADAVLLRAGLLFVTATSAVAAYRSAAAGDVGSTAFVAASYATLLLLFRSLRAYERLPLGAAREVRSWLKRDVWVLYTLLTGLFAWKVAETMPALPVAAAVWAMAVLTTLSGFVALFHRP
ncbi:hypothetical protein EJB05_46301, partial [Eragrostis curvula]